MKKVWKYKQNYLKTLFPSGYRTKQFSCVPYSRIQGIKSSFVIDVFSSSKWMIFRYWSVRPSVVFLMNASDIIRKNTPRKFLDIRFINKLLMYLFRVWIYDRFKVWLFLSVYLLYYAKHLCHIVCIYKTAKILNEKKNEEKLARAIFLENKKKLCYLQLLTVPSIGF